MANQVKPIIIRLPPKLDEALKAESARRDVSVNWIILQMLGSAYGIDVTDVVRRAPKKHKEHECLDGSTTTTPLQQPP